MNIQSEWKILVNAAQRRVDANIYMIEDETILQIDCALRYILTRVNIDDQGYVTLGRGNVNDNLQNAISYGENDY